MSERYIVAIEIGSSKIRGAIAVADDAGMVDVIAAEEEKLIDLVRYGCIQNVDVSKSIDHICERLENYSRLSQATITGTYVSIGGKSLSSKIVEVSTELPSEMEITSQLIDDLKNKAKAMIDDSRDVVDVVPIKFSVDNKTQVAPVGSYGQSVSARMAVISCQAQIKRMLRRVLTERSKLDINGYIVRPLAEASMVLTDNERQLGCMFVDFGAETTTVSIYKSGTLCYLVTLPMGSRNITRDLTSLNYTEDRADEIKRSSGNAMPPEGVRRNSADGIDYTKINNYVHARAAEIVQNILAQIEYAGLKSTDLPSGIVIVGGGAKLRGFNELLGKQSKMTVRVGSVGGPVRVSDGAIHVSDNIDVIATLLAASKLPDAECVEFPPVDDAEQKSSATGSYEDLYANSDDDGVSRIGRGYDDDDSDNSSRNKKSKDLKDKNRDVKRKHPSDSFDDEQPEEDEEKNSGNSLFSGIRKRLSNIWGGDDSFEG